MAGEQQQRQTGARPRRRPRPRRLPFYSVLDDREAWELAQLGDASLAQEMGVLRLRVAQLLMEPDPDWKETLRAIEVLVRMARVQQGLPAPAQEAAGVDALREFGLQVAELFGTREGAGG